MFRPVWMRPESRGESRGARVPICTSPANQSSPPTAPAPYVSIYSLSLLLRQVRDRLFRVFRRYVGMTRAPMLHGVF